MNNSNRFVNRLVLIVGGILSILVAAAASALALRPPWILPPMQSMFDALLRFFDGWRIEALPHPVLGLLVAVSASALVLACLMLWFLMSRPQSAPTTLVRSRNDVGEVTVSDATAAQILTEPLGDRSDVISATCRSAYVRGDTALRVSIKARRPAPTNRASRRSLSCAVARAG